MYKYVYFFIKLLIFRFYTFYILGYNKNMKIAIEMEQYREDEDGQHMLIENNL